MSEFKSSNKEEAQKFRQNYRKAAETAIGTQFGPKVREHYSGKKSKGGKLC
jgi:hypothetical protein